LGERATVEWPLRRFYAFARPDEVASVGSVDDPWICGRRCEEI
jgi:hypothetical protein